MQLVIIYHYVKCDINTFVTAHGIKCQMVYTNTYWCTQNPLQSLYWMLVAYLAQLQICMSVVDNVYNA